jgi:5'-3' exonuclease
LEHWELAFGEARTNRKEGVQTFSFLHKQLIDFQRLGCFIIWETKIVVCFEQKRKKKKRKRIGRERAQRNQKKKEEKKKSSLLPSSLSTPLLRAS